MKTEREVLLRLAAAVGELLDADRDAGSYGRSPYASSINLGLYRLSLRAAWADAVKALVSTEEDRRDWGFDG